MYQHTIKNKQALIILNRTNTTITTALSGLQMEGN